MSDLARRFDYHIWASRTLADLLDDSEAHAAARRVMWHLAEADLLWVARIEQNESHEHELWHSPSADACRRRVAAAAQAIGRVLNNVDSDALTHSISYETTSAEPFSTPLVEILEHLLLHGAHHRGQVAAALRAAGGEPPRTDYIAWIRL